MGRKSYSDVAMELRRSIEEGAYQRFERLPPSRRLAEDMGVEAEFKVYPLDAILSCSVRCTGQR